MADATPNGTGTEVRRIPADENDIEGRIKFECDALGSAGYLLASSCVLGDEVLLIFQRSVGVPSEERI